MSGGRTDLVPNKNDWNLVVGILYSLDLLTDLGHGHEG